MAKWEVYNFVNKGGPFSAKSETIHFFIASGLGEMIEIGDVDPRNLSLLRSIKKKAAEVAAEMNRSPTYP